MSLRSLPVVFVMQEGLLYQKKKPLRFTHHPVLTCLLGGEEKDVGEGSRIKSGQRECSWAGFPGLLANQPGSTFTSSGQEI